MSNDNITRLPINSDQRRKNKLGNYAVPCMVSERWLRFSNKWDSVDDKKLMIVDVMTMGENEKKRKICELAISKSDLLQVLNSIED